LQELNNWQAKMQRAWTLLKENTKGRWLWVWLFLATTLILFYLLSVPLREWVNDFIRGGFIITASLVTWITAARKKLKPYYRHVNHYYQKLKSIKNTIDARKIMVQTKEKAEVVRLRADLQKQLEIKRSLEKEEAQKQAEITRLKEELEQIKTGKLLSTFLAEKAADDVYIKQLGLISVIRKDFARLNDLFQRQKVAQDQSGDETENKTKVQIDRIVLYIDDLDRCSANVVVKVLEAIHLLLAFPLFVVIVGVDPRWLNNALKKKYKTLFGISSNGNGTISADGWSPASPYDYLEKIFQIPFTLKPISATGQRKLITSLIKGEMDQESLAEYGQEQREVMAQGGLAQTREGVTNPDQESTEAEAKQLTFTYDELHFMQEIAPLYGYTPRTIKRFVNIYRIIKAHDNYRHKTNFKPTLFTLAVLIGCAEKAHAFLLHMLATPYVTLDAFLKHTPDLNLLEKWIYDRIGEDLVREINVNDIRQNLELLVRFSFRPVQLYQVNG
jgi:hypothetical protein